MAGGQVGVVLRQRPQLSPHLLVEHLRLDVLRQVDPRLLTALLAPRVVARGDLRLLLLGQRRRPAGRTTRPLRPVRSRAGIRPAAPGAGTPRPLTTRRGLAAPCGGVVTSCRRLATACWRLAAGPGRLSAAPRGRAATSPAARGSAPPRLVLLGHFFSAPYAETMTAQTRQGPLPKKRPLS